MSNHKIIVLFIIASMLMFSCIGSGNDGTGAGSGLIINYADPDPISPDELSTTPKAPAEVYIAANIDGEIRLFTAAAPAGYSTLVTDASTQNNFSKIRISEDRNHLLYVNTEGSLILYNISDGIFIEIRANVSCNETQFIDSELIQYSHSSDIYCYRISDGYEYQMIDDPQLFCNHGAVVSPDGSRIVFKDQNPEQSVYAVIAWADVTGSPVTETVQLGEYTGDIELLELFDFLWLDNETIFMKSAPGSGTLLDAYDLGMDSSWSSTVLFEGEVVHFSNIRISDDLSKICFFGSFGLYQVETSGISSGIIAAEEIYSSEIITTEFAAYSVTSNYFVAATRGCIGVYEADTLRQTNFDSTQIIAEGETLYSLDCR